MLTPGQIVGNYRIIRQLGQGGMGAVYAAEHQVIGRRAAIKVLHASLSADPSLANRFLNEARAVNLIEHAGLVEIYEYGVLPEGGAYIVMEYLEGETLHAARRRHGRLTAEAAAIGLQIAEALAAAHARDIIHRDLKPDNVMLVRDRANPRQIRIKILDFGIAKLAPPPGAPGGAPLTGTGVAVGTPEYMSPEQCKGQAVDGRSDCYSLGVLLYELLIGQRPYEAEFAFDVMRMQVHGPVPTLPPDVPAPLRALVERLLAKDPAARPTMAEVVEQLTPLSRPLLGTPGGTIGIGGTAEVAPLGGSAAPAIAVGAATPSAAVLPTLPAGAASLPSPVVAPVSAPAPPPAAAASAGSIDPSSLFAANAIGPTVRRERPRSLLRTAGLGVAVVAGVALLLVGGGNLALRESASRQPAPPPPTGDGVRAAAGGAAPPVQPPAPLPTPVFKEIPDSPASEGAEAAEGKDGGVATAKVEPADRRKLRDRQRPRGAKKPEAGQGSKPAGDSPFKDF